MTQPRLGRLAGSLLGTHRKAMQLPITSKTACELVSAALRATRLCPCTHATAVWHLTQTRTKLLGQESCSGSDAFQS